ncbi:restriction endonuclease [Streptomyces sp. NPDC058326]|uniref:restriction endonuclease n=1 Tax=Streptomyces sp. NPDC058326 TaxID=3346447 RepID=UPI0036E76C3E
MTHGSIVHDPTGRWDTHLPLDREPNERLAAAVLRWRKGDDTIPPQGDIEQAALQLTGYASLLVREVQTTTAALPRDGQASTVAARTLAQITVREAIRRLSVAPVSQRHALPAAQSRARLVQALHRALDRTLAATHTPVPGP